ncbi:MAG: hypothetical protein ACI8QC_002600 [Planctomycetota bacterium]|jgi:hypothetical protein
MSTRQRYLGSLSISLLTVALCTAQSGRAKTPAPDFITGVPADEVFDEAVKPFLKSYCTKCHSRSKRKGEVVLSGISSDLAAGQDMHTWKAVLKQLVLEEMPPANRKQPNKVESDAVIRWINAELDKSGNASDLYAKLESPSFGNYVNHEKLFSGEVETEPFSPARLWRTSPNVFDNIKSGFGGDVRHLRQPFLLEDKMGIKDYANMLFADSAVVNTLLGNAGNTADHLIRTEYLAIASAGTAPAKSELTSVLNQHFKRVVYRDATESELDNYCKLFERAVGEGGHAEALRVVLMAVMLHHESVYRLEIGLGAEGSSGRRMLSSTELAFALAYALTDHRPDEALLEAARDGELVSQEDAQYQVKRMLEDDSIEKPRTLRFFQEFFGYAQAHKIFKDEKRSGGFAYYGENYPNMYERDADFFVMHILEEDKDVFERLLTSDEYFILNRQTFRNTVYDFYKQNQAELDAGVFPEAKQQELLLRLDLKGWHELNEKYFLHNFNRGFNGSIRAIKQIVKECGDWKNTEDEETLLHSMQPLYKKYPMVYDLRDDEQDFLLPQPYKRPNRAGMLTHPAWLIAHSLNDGTDPVRRGKWVRERLLAGVVPDIPITVDATVPEDHSKTLRERFKITESKECWRCHVKMNPLGYTFEMFDDFGRVRTQEQLGDGGSKPINARGELQGTDESGVDGKVEDALELIGRLAKSDKVRQSIIRHVFRYYMGRNEMLSDSKTLIAADQAYLESGGSYKALVISLLSSDSFLYRKQLGPASGYSK